MTQRIGWAVVFLAVCSCGSIQGQTATAGCMQGPNCGVQGSGSGSSNGSPKPASTPQNRTAAAMNAMQNNLQSTTQMINNAGTAILNALQPNNDSDTDTDTDTIPASNADPGIQPVSYMDSASGTNGGALGSSNNSAAAVNSLLDPGLPPSSANSAINSLLGDSGPSAAAASTPASEVANLLGFPTPQPNEGIAQSTPGAASTPAMPMAPMDNLAQDAINPAANTSQDQIGPAMPGTKTAWTDDPKADPNYQAAVLIGRPQVNSVVQGVGVANDLMTGGLTEAAQSYVVDQIKDLLYGDALKDAAIDKATSLYKQYQYGLGSTSTLPTPAPGPTPNPQ